MSYVKRPDFDQPTAEDVQRIRRTTMWLVPIGMVQVGTNLMRGGEVGFQILNTLSWSVMTIAILWVLVGWPLRWMSKRDQHILNDDWARATRDAATRWGLIAVVVIGCGLMSAQIWVDVGTRLAINLLVGGGLSVAGLRFAWLNRAGPDEDE